MKHFVWAAVTLAALFFSGGAYACNVPNPNLNAPPFVDGCAVPASALNNLGAYAGAVYTPLSFGAKADGVTNDTVAIQACLTAAGNGNGRPNATGWGGTCYLGSYRYYLGGNVTIPAGTMLMCGYNRVTTQNPALLNTQGAIVRNGAATITAGGDGAAIEGCTITLSGLTYPVTNDGSFAGIAVSDGGYSNFTVENMNIFSVDTAIYITGVRFHINNLSLDGTGIAHAVIELDTPSDGDSGDLSNFETNSGFDQTFSCANSGRAGTGLRVYNATSFGTATVFIYGRAVMQPFQTADFDFENGALIDTIWADNDQQTCSSYTPGQVGVIIGAHATVQAGNITSDGNTTGISIAAGAFVSIGTLYTEGSCNSGSGCTYGGGATDAALVDNDTTGDVRISRATINESENAPYIYNNSGAGIVIGNDRWSKFWLGTLDWDNDTWGADPYAVGTSATWRLGAGSENAGGISGVAATVTCTGLGTGGTCVAGTDPGLSITAGAVSLTTGSASLGTSGTVVITLPAPLSALNIPVCQSSAPAWAGTTPYGVTESANGTSATLAWNTLNTASAAANSSMLYTCKFI